MILRSKSHKRFINLWLGELCFDGIILNYQIFIFTSLNWAETCMDMILNKRSLYSNSSELTRQNISWQLHENPFTRFSITLLTNRGLENSKCQHWIKKVNSNIPKIFQFVLCLTSNLCWKCHANPLIRCPVMLRTDTDFVENAARVTQCSGG